MARPRNRGGKLGRPRALSDEQVREVIGQVRALDRMREECCRAALAKKYGVSEALIGEISLHGRWYLEKSKIKRCKGAMAPEEASP